MTKLTIESKPGTRAADALAPHVGPFYSDRPLTDEQHEQLRLGEQEPDATPPES